MRILVVLAIGVLFAACGSSSDEDTVGKEIADDYNEAMDKARAVEEELQEHVDEIDKAVEEAMDEVDEAIEKQRNP
jgi:peptidoglycan hydrolase CwlO-like protein